MSVPPFFGVVMDFWPCSSNLRGFIYFSRVKGTIYFLLEFLHAELICSLSNLFCFLLVPSKWEHPAAGAVRVAPPACGTRVPRNSNAQPAEPSGATSTPPAGFGMPAQGPRSTRRFGAAGLPTRAMPGHSPFPWGRAARSTWVVSVNQGL